MKTFLLLFSLSASLVGQTMHSPPLAECSVVKVKGHPTCPPTLFPIPTPAETKAMLRMVGQTTPKPEPPEGSGYSQTAPKRVIKKAAPSVPATPLAKVCCGSYAYTVTYNDVILLHCVGYIGKPSGCVIAQGHTLDEVMDVIVQSQSPQPAAVPSSERSTK